MHEQNFINEINLLYDEIKKSSNGLINLDLKKRALELIERALKEYPSSSRLWCICGDLLQVMAGPWGDNIDHDYIIKCYNNAIDADKQNAEAYESLAYFYDVYGSNYVNTERLFREAITLGAQLPSYLGLARVLAEAGRRQEALDILTSAFEKYGNQDSIVKLISEIHHGVWGQDSS